MVPLVQESHENAGIQEDLGLQGCSCPYSSRSMEILSSGFPSNIPANSIQGFSGISPTTTCSSPCRQSSATETPRRRGARPIRERIGKSHAPITGVIQSHGSGGIQRDLLPVQV